MGLVYPRQQALQSPETFATVAHAIIRDQYGEQVYDWDPATVYLELQADFRADTCTEVIDRWSAMQVIMTTDAFFKRLDAFMAICNTLADGAPFFSAFNPVTTEEAAWGIVEVALNRELLPFSYAIKKYLRETLKLDGFSETSYPAVFQEVFDGKPSADDIRDGLGASANKDNIGLFVDEQLGDLVSQFDRIPDMRALDGIIMERGFEEAMKSTNKEEA